RKDADHLWSLSRNAINRPFLARRQICNFFFPSARFSLYETAPEAFIYPVSSKVLVSATCFTLLIPSAIADPFPLSGPFTGGKRALLHLGHAAAPKKAPLAVKRAIWAANQLCSKAYRYGGGHKSFVDRAYDCSGTVCYVLGAAGLISSPMSSTEFCRYGQRGRGKWITIYARDGHTIRSLYRQMGATLANDRSSAARL